MDGDRIGLEKLQKTLSKCYTKELCYPKVSGDWNENNKCLGMCAITALVVNNQYGGLLGKIRINGVSHYFNVINDKIVDLTATQFNSPVDYSNYKIVERRAMLSDNNTRNRYEKLKKRVSNQDTKHEKNRGTNNEGV